MTKLIDNMDLIELEIPTISKTTPSDNDLILEFDDGIAEDILRKEYKRRHPQKIFWTMGNGQKINIKEMSDEHLLNAIKLIQRKKQELEEYRWAFGEDF